MVLNLQPTPVDLQIGEMNRQLKPEGITIVQDGKEFVIMQEIARHGTLIEASDAALLAGLGVKPT